MAIAIDKFDSRYSRAFEGQLVNTLNLHVLSGVNEGAEDIHFGRFITRSGEYQGVAMAKSGTAADDIIGVSVRSVAMENDVNKDVAYHQGVNVSYVSDENIFVKAVGGAVRGEKVHVLMSDDVALAGTAVASGTAGAVEVNAVYMENAAAGDIVGVKLGDLLG